MLCYVTEAGNRAAWGMTVWVWDAQGGGPARTDGLVASGFGVQRGPGMFGGDGML